MRVQLFIGNLDLSRQAAWKRAVEESGGWLELVEQLPVPVSASDETVLFGCVAPDVSVASACAWLRQACLWMADYPDVVLCGAQVAAPHYERPGWNLLYPDLVREDMVQAARCPSPPAPQPVQHVVRGVWLARADVFAQVGGFAPELGDTFLADVDLCRRLTDHWQAQHGSSVAPIWLLPTPTVVCIEMNDDPVDEVTFESQATHFACRQSFAPLPDAEAWFRSDNEIVEALTAARQAAAIASTSLDRARQDLFAPADFVFRSRVPVIGSFIAAFRQLWFSVAAKWAMRAYRQQQAQMNLQHGEAVQALAASLSHLIEALDRQRLSQALDRDRRIRSVVERLDQAFMDEA